MKEESLLTTLHCSVDAQISEKFTIPESPNRLSVQKALLLKSYLCCRMLNWSEAESSAVDAFRLGQINKDSKTISHALVLLSFSLRRQNKHERLIQILDNLLSAELANQSPVLLFFAALYRLEPSRNFPFESKPSMPHPQLAGYGFKHVFEQFIRAWNGPKYSDVLFRAFGVRGAELLSLAAVMPFSEDYLSLWSRVFKRRMQALAKLLPLLNSQFVGTVFEWLFHLQKHALSSFFEQLQLIPQNSFNSSSNALILIMMMIIAGF